MRSTPVSPPPPFQRLLDEHADAVLRLCIATVGRPDADDAFQETFLAALRAYPRLRRGSDPRAWLMTIAHRKSIDIHRDRVRRPLPVAEPEHHAGAAPTAPDATTDSWERVRALPPRQRAVLTLRYAADLTHAEIASALDCTEEASRRAAADGLKTLRKELLDATVTA